MSPAVSVASLKDARAITALRVQVARGMTRDFGQGHWSALPTLASVKRQIRASHVLVARQDDDIIGTVRLVVAQRLAIDSESFSPVRTALYVFGLAVAPEARKQGVGRALMDAAKEKTRSWPAQALWLDAYEHRAGAGSFYLACGFRKVGPSTQSEVPVIFYEWLVD